jgi:hypothetical protein
MHRPLFVITAGSVAACGALIIASALPAAAATADRSETTAFTSSTPIQPDPPFPTLVPCTAPGAGDCQDTPVTFSVTSSGVLAITAPTTLVDLGTAQEAVVTGAVGATIGSAGNFGAVTVTDNRAIDPADWTATVSSTDFVATSSTGATDTIPAGDATYLIPPVGSATFGAIAATGTLPLPGTTDLPGGAADGSLLDLAIASDTYPAPPLGGITLSATPTPVVTVAGADGDNGATWSPEIDVTVPATAVIGAYDGWVTHSVS